MTNEMKYLMYLYACAAGSVSADSPEYVVDFKKLYKLADKMSLLSMLAYAVRISPDIGCPDEIRSNLYAVMLGTSLKNKMRTEAVLDVLDDIEKTGIKAVVAKGLDCARYYTVPECRISADTDIFIHKKDEKKLLEYFAQNGYIVEPRGKHEHHSTCTSSKTGVFEVHVKMWEDHVYDVMQKRIGKIRNCIGNSRVVSVNQRQIRVFDRTDAMIFMTLHLVKHFMFSHANLKMSYDLALYYINNKDFTDNERYRTWVKKSGYETIVSAVFSAMVLYCGFRKEDFEAITCFDKRRGGVFAESISQYNSSDTEESPDAAVMVQYYTMKGNISRMGKWYAFLYNFKKVTAEKFMVLFPRISHLKKSYPYLQKHPYLYLAACIHRFFARGTVHVFHSDPKSGRIINYRENLSSQISEDGEKRIGILQDMNLL